MPSTSSLPRYGCGVVFRPRRQGNLSAGGPSRGCLPANHRRTVTWARRESLSRVGHGHSIAWRTKRRANGVGRKSDSLMMWDPTTPTGTTGIGVRMTPCLTFTRANRKAVRSGASHPRLRANTVPIGRSSHAGGCVRQYSRSGSSVAPRRSRSITVSGSAPSTGPRYPRPDRS